MNGYTPNNTIVVVGKGTPLDSAFHSTPGDGQQWVDEDSGTVFTRIKGSWTASAGDHGTAGTVFVGPTGNDGNSGILASSPKATLVGALTGFSAGVVSMAVDTVNSVTSTIVLPNYVRILGAFRDDGQGFGASHAAYLNWTGAASPAAGSAILKTLNGRQQYIERVALNMGSTTGLIGIYFTSTNSPPQAATYVDHVSVSGVAGNGQVGLQGGTGGGDGNENGPLNVTDIWCAGVDTGVLYQGANTPNLGVLRGGYFNGCKFGVRLISVISCEIRDVINVGPAPDGTRGAFIAIEPANGLNGNVRVINCEDENVVGVYGRWAALVIGRGGITNPFLGSIILESNIFNSHVKIAAQGGRVVSRGNTYGNNVWMPSAATNTTLPVTFDSAGDVFSAGRTVTGGMTGTNLVTLTAGVFTNSDIGAMVTPTGAGAWILSVPTSTTAILSQTANTGGNIALQVGASQVVTSNVGRTVTDGTTDNTGLIVTSATAYFNTIDIDLPITVGGVARTVASVQSASQCTLSAAVTPNLASATLTVGVFGASPYNTLIRVVGAAPTTPLVAIAASHVVYTPLAPYIAATGTIAVTLPAALGASGTQTLKNVGVGTVTLTAAGSDLIDGAATQALTANQSLTYYSDGAAWRILAKV